MNYKEVVINLFKRHRYLVLTLFIVILCSVNLGYYYFYYKNNIFNGVDHRNGRLILICIAKIDINQGEIITSDHIGYKEIRENFKPYNSYFYKDRTMLKGLTPNKQIHKGDIFMKEMFIQNDSNKK